MRVVCAMSGGVDSSVAAATLVEQGHEVIGMTMRLTDHEPDAVPRKATCCSPAEIHQARDVCARLGIPHYTVDERATFQESVIEDFVREYATGRTPNPCTRCNQHVKFGPLLRRAAALGAERLATGHYARIVDGALLRAADPDKDQSYFLFAMGCDAVRRVVFPLGETTKTEVRERARNLNLPNWNAPDSQELCFVSPGGRGAMVEREAAARSIDTTALAPGPIVDRGGRVVGRHGGVHTVTVGQRRGLGVSGSRRRYVLRVIPQRREVVVGDEHELAVRALRIAELHRLGEMAGDLAVQIRHRADARPAAVTVDGAAATVEFAEPVLAAAPGQAAVVYRGDQVVGGGWIETILDPTP